VLSTLLNPKINEKVAFIVFASETALNDAVHGCPYGRETVISGACVRLERAKDNPCCNPTTTRALPREREVNAVWIIEPTSSRVEKIAQR
jgi:hypothetical protein